MTGGDSNDGVIVMIGILGILGVIRGLVWLVWLEPWDTRVVSIQVQ